MNHGETRRPEEIQAEIEHTRSEMDSTLRQIEQRLNPRHLMDQGVEYLRNSGGKEFVTNLRGSVKDNPLPVTLVGIGLAWLMATSRNTGHRAESGMSTQKLSSAAQGASQRLSSTAQAARERVSRLGESARGLGESARQRAQQARGGYERIVQEQPLALGALGLAIGALLAASVPRTRKEDELMGPAKESLAERAKERIDEMSPQAAGRPEESARRGDGERKQTDERKQAGERTDGGGQETQPPPRKITVGVVETGPL